jgi:hypothetical protein
MLTRSVLCFPVSEERIPLHRSINVNHKHTRLGKLNTQIDPTVELDESS